MRHLATLGLLALSLAACTDRDGPTPTETAPAPQIAAPGELSRALRLGPLKVTCQEGDLSAASRYRLCMPRPWNGVLLIYNHGYASPLTPGGPAIPEDELGGVAVQDVVTQLGFAYMASSYPKKGLAVQEAVQEDVQMAGLFTTLKRRPLQVYVAGASEGGLITTLAVERYPNVFNGGVAACGPIGDFRRQLDYFGDFRVVFDAFFASQIPGWPVWRQGTPPDPRFPGFVPPAEVAQALALQPALLAALAANPALTAQLLSVTQAAIDPADPAGSVPNTVLRVLGYNLGGTNDAILTLGGQPFDNSSRVYTGSLNDGALNAAVQRFVSTGSALASLQAYQTTGKLRRPLTTLHTTLDPEVPFWHEPLYRAKVAGRGAGLLLTQIPAARYGHCSFTREEVVVALVVTVLKATGQELLLSPTLLPSPASRERLLEVAARYGASPQVVLP